MALERALTLAVALGGDVGFVGVERDLGVDDEVAPLGQANDDVWLQASPFVVGVGDLYLVLIAAAQSRSFEHPLDARYRDHDLSGDWAGYRECHIKPDLLLIYRKSGSDILRLARLGSHGEIFG